MILKSIFGHKKEDEGINLIRQKKYKEAFDICNRWLIKEPSNPQAILSVAIASYYLNKKDILKENLFKLSNLELTDEIKKLVLEITGWKIISSPQWYSYPPVWNFNGSWLAYCCAKRDTNNDTRINQYDRPGLYIYDFARKTEYEILPDDFWNSEPYFSPDGKYLLYLSARKDTDGDKQITNRDISSLYICNLESGEEKLIISEEYKIKYPSFSPDGKWILFCAYRKNSNKAGVYMINFQTGQERVVSRELFEHTFPSFSPDGKFVLYVSWRYDTNNDGIIDIHDNSAIYLKNLQTDEEITIASQKYSNSFPTFSKSGRYIVFLSHRRDTNKDGKIDSLDNAGIYLYDIKSNKEIELISDEFYNKFPIFTFDDENILYIGSWRGKEKKITEEIDYFESKGIYSYNINSKKERQIISDKHFGSRSPTPSPVDSKFVYLSWSKGTRRGIYLADFENLPSNDELLTIIKENL